MDRPRPSIRTMIALVALAAFDSAVFRWAWIGIHQVDWAAMVALPMANILVALAFRPGAFRNGGRLREDRVGFQVLGWSALTATLAIFLGFPQVFVNFVKLFEPATRVWFESEAFRAAEPRSPARLRIWWCAQVTHLAAISTACMLMQFLIAWGGVRLASLGNHRAR